ncbi:MAG: T9SS type A sorting domain-containing protein [Lewinella sp.]|uniref:T9SS type A sorting domain-containing protein n=1 Tax=Lewinella sp. TaxID=2004506 RepID=UPI003D6C52E9
MKTQLTFFLLLSVSLINAQKHDYIWKTGYGSYPTGTIAGGVDIDFNFTPPDTTYLYRDLDFIRNSTTICDEWGNILFSSNGCRINGADDLKLLNGDTINPGYYFNEFCDTANNLIAYPAIQDIFFLPHPTDTNLYYLVHARLGYVQPPQGEGGMNEYLYYSLVDKRLDNGRGDVIEKNVEILHDTMSMSSISAVRHGNGQDWWIITNEQATDNYIFVRLDADGFYESHRQAIGGFDREDGATGQNNFSPDGNWFARFGRYNGLILYRFNRCEGSLHQPLYDEVPMAADSSISTGGVAFSPNSRLLYLVTNLWIDQYDLWAEDIIGSKQRVATWDGTLIPPANVGTFFYLPQLGPDGKIYIGAINTIPYLHVIEQPNERGYACHVNQLGFPLPSRNGLLIPYFPNYRLGALGPGGCDSLPTSTWQVPIHAEEKMNLFPNPASERVQVQFGSTVQPDDLLVIRDLSGRELWRQAAQQQTLHLEKIPPGTYLVEWWRKAGKLAVERLICN